MVNPTLHQIITLLIDQKVAHLWQTAAIIKDKRKIIKAIADIVIITTMALMQV